ncbi:MAG: gluconolactonase [Streptosporangiales bacterium]|nr:gluconolactonase [Streptosporangiales bacterium]
MSREITTVATGFSFLEGPRWHDGRIWFSDFYTHRVLSAEEDGGDLRVEAEVPGQPSGLGWLPDGRLLIVSMRDTRLLRREPDGSLVTHADLAEHVAGYANDMVVDDQGRAYVGNFGFDLMGGAPLETACLLRVDPDGKVTQVADELWFPNGSVITDDGVLLVDETFGNRVSAFDIAPDGSLSGHRIWASFGDPPGAERDLATVIAGGGVGADGCCLDAEGAMWIADGAAGRLLRVREGGEIVEEIDPPGTAVFACMLGGADGRTLYACAAPDFFEEPRKAAREAELLAIRVDVPHAGRP